jgi:hypothetical protein
MRIKFLGEQGGSVEDALKNGFREEFLNSPSVLSAYLARLTYDESPEYSVALCIRSTSGTDSVLQGRLVRVFTSIFRPDQSLDTLFIRADQELELQQVCKPFYERPNP